MIRLNQIQKLYLTDDVETTALKQITVEIQEKEFIVITGPSGCGKSTLLSILGLLDTPSSGDYRFGNETVSGLKEKDLCKIRSRDMGFIFQNFNLIEDLSIEKNVALPLKYQKLSRLQLEERVHHVLEQVGIAHRAKHLPNQLSGGQQQRAAIARALVGRPRVIFADEPTGNLDSEHAKQVLTMLQDINKKGTTVVMVTHNLEQVTFCDRHIRLLDGQIMAIENIASLKAH